jgi:transketolase
MAEIVNARLAYGKALLELGMTHPDVVVLSADVSNSDHSFMFAEAYPDRFFNVGIAEPSLVDTAVGLAYAGKVPFANTFAVFLATRAIEMVRTHCCYGRANVKLMGAYAGLSDSFDGPTHNSITDIAMMRSLPNMAVVVPSDAISLRTLLPQVADWRGAVYFRVCRNDVETIHDENYSPVMGKADVLREGGDFTIITAGVLSPRVLRAAERLANKGLKARVLEMHTIKPLDNEAVIEAAHQTGAIVTVEEHSIIGGLGGAVAEVVGEEAPVPVKRVGLHDRFAETGPYEAILDEYGMSVEDIVRAAEAAVRGKRR